MPTPSTTLPASTLPPIDLAVIENLRALDDGGDGFLAEVLGMFRAESPARLSAIRCAAAGPGGRELVDVAHALKGSARTLGLLRLADVCQAIESLAKDGQRPDPAILRQLDLEYAAVSGALAAAGVREGV